MLAMRQRPTDAPPELANKENVTGDAREGVTAKDLSAKLKGATTPKSVAMLDPKEQEAKSEPAILLPDYSDYKPTQNTTAPTNQWYKGGVTKESN